MGSRLSVGGAFGVWRWGKAGVGDLVLGGRLALGEWGDAGICVLLWKWTESLFPDTHVVSARRINLGVTTNIHT